MEFSYTNTNSFLTYYLVDKIKDAGINIEPSYKMALNEIENVLTQQTDEERIATFKKLDNLISQVKVTVNNSFQGDEKNYRVEFLSRFEDRIFELEKVLNSVTSVKIVWNEEHVVLYKLFRELKNKVTIKGNPYISNTYRDIAKFIKYHFKGFENVNEDTIFTELKRNTHPKKKERLVDLNDLLM